MIIDLPSTTTSQVNTKLVELREQGGAVTLGRVLNLVIVTDDGSRTEEAVDAANDASREHPCRVIVVARGTKKAAARLDAQIRVGGDAGASEVVVLRLYGPLAGEGAASVVPLLLPDTPVVAWWPFGSPAAPAQDPIGALAQRRITDSAAERNPIKAIEARRTTYVDGDTDLAWTRLTLWRAVLASSLDLPPFEKVESASVTGEADSPSTDLLAGWLAAYLRVPVYRMKADGEGIVSVQLNRRSGTIELNRPDGKVGTLNQPQQPLRRVALHRRSRRDCLSEELRRLDGDETYAATLQALDKITRGRPGTTKTGNARSGSAKTGSAKASGAKSGSASSPDGNAAQRKSTAKRKSTTQGKSTAKGKTATQGKSTAQNKSTEQGKTARSKTAAASKSGTKSSSTKARASSRDASPGGRR